MVQEEAVVAPEEGASISPYVIDDKGVNPEFVVHIYFDDLDSGDVAFPLLWLRSLTRRFWLQCLIKHGTALLRRGACRWGL